MAVKLLREFVKQVLLEKKQPFDMAVFRELSGEAAEEYLDFHAKVLGSGVGRVAYDVGNGFVVKWAINKGGAKANKREATMSKCAPPSAPVVPVHEAGPGFSWVLVDRVEHVTGKKLARVLQVVTGLDMPSDGYIDSIVWSGLNPKAVKTGDLVKHLLLYKTNEWYRALFDTVKSCKLNVFELHSDNWGLDKNGDLVLLDTGT